jgi:hypothetical protein
VRFSSENEGKLSHTGPTYHEQLQHIVADYQAEGRPWPATARDMALWAIDHKRWIPRFHDYAGRLAADLSDAMRVEYFVDAQGRKVRAKHAARQEDGPKQLPIWDDIRTAPREHMQIAARQRREQIACDCYQLKVDVDWYNENREPSIPIQLVLDFTNDVQERELEEHI